MNFLLRYSGFFLFLLLEGYSLYLVGQYNKKQNEIYVSSANALTGVIYEQFSELGKFARIQAMADSLAQENANLRTRLESEKYNNSLQKGTVVFPLDTSLVLTDSTDTPSPSSKDLQQEFKYIVAEVINNSISRPDNYLTINRGSLHGVKQGMGVIAPDGIVGVVRNVTPHFSQVMSVLHKQTSVSAMIRRNRYFGSLVWRGGNPKHMILDNIPKHAQLMKGDTIITSGLSEIYPGEIRIGTIADFKVENGSNFYTIDVLLGNDIARANYVYVVENMFREELKTLRKEN